MESHDKPPLPRWAETTEALQKGLGSAGKIAAGVIVVALVGILVWSQVRHDAMVLEPFEVPAELQKKGWSGSGKALANALLDELRGIEQRADTAFFSESRFSAAWSPKPPDLHIGEQGFSVSALSEAIQFLSGRLRSVTGELVEAGPTLELRVHPAGASPRCYRYGPATPAVSLPQPCILIPAGAATSMPEGLHLMLAHAAEDLYLDI
jgi:hypothetical protein